MSNPPPTWIRRLSVSWSFYRDNFKLSIRLAFFSLLVLSAALYLLQPLSKTIFGQALLAVSLGLGVASIFNVLYESKTRISFRDMLSDINPNIQSGVIVHESRRDVIGRCDALARYCLPKRTVRIMTSTADNYVKKGEDARDFLLQKVSNEKCKVKILLYLPVQEQREGVLVGQRRRTPQEIMWEHQALMSDYESLVEEGKGGVSIKYFTLPLHINFIMIGNERMFSAPVLHSVSGRDLPCYEIYPTGERSLFYKFMNDFDYIYENNKPGVTLTFDEVKSVYNASDFQYDMVREKFVKTHLP